MIRQKIAKGHCLVYFQQLERHLERRISTTPSTGIGIRDNWWEVVLRSVRREAAPASMAASEKHERVLQLAKLVRNLREYGDDDLELNESMRAF